MDKVTITIGTVTVDVAAGEDAVSSTVACEGCGAAMDASTISLTTTECDERPGPAPTPRTAYWCSNCRGSA